MHERFASASRRPGTASPAAHRARPPSRSIAAAIERQIGRLLARNARAAARYRDPIVDDPTRRLGLAARLERRDPNGTTGRATARAATSCAPTSPTGPTRTCGDLHPAHRGRSRLPHPQERLAIRPIWHQNEDRVKAHILVCFLAYVLWKTLEQWQSRAGLGNSPRTILDELARIHSADIVLPTADGSARELRLRCVVRPDRAQAALLDRLGLTPSRSACACLPPNAQM